MPDQKNSVAELRQKSEAERIDLMVEQRVAERTRELAAQLASAQAAHEASSRSEERYKRMVDNISIGIIVVRDGRFVFANPTALEITGYTREEIDGADFLPLIHADDKALVLDRHVRRQRGEQVEPRYEFRVQRRDGSVIWVELAAVLIQWEGQPATLSFLSDISMRKAAEAAVLRSEEHYRNVIAAAPVGIIVVRSNRIRLANHAMLEMVGFTHEEMLSMPSFLEWVHEDDRPMMADHARSQVWQTGQSRQVVSFRIRRKNGSVAWVEGSNVQVDWEGQPATMAFIRDITDQHDLARNLQLALSEREIILETSVVGIAFLNPEGRVRWANTAMRELFCVSEQDLVGRSLEPFYPTREEYRAVGAAVSAKVKSGQPFSSEVRMLRGDGSPFWAHLSGRAVSQVDLSRGTIWTVLDITQRRQAEDDTRMALVRQRELNELKTRFVAMTSHEFRTPLSTILSSAELLHYYGDRLPTEEKGKLAGSIKSSVQRMARMLDGVLMIGRADAGKLEFQPERVSPEALVRSLADEAARAAASDGSGPARLDFVGEGGRDEVMLDDKLLRHIIGNLVGNAFKYSPESGRVRVSVKRQGDELHLSVADAGIGIPLEDQPRLFESFHRASNVGNIQGTGLGLAIVKRAVDLHEGRISVDSAPGAGTCFDVILPIRNAKNQEAAQ